MATFTQISLFLGGVGLGLLGPLLPAAAQCHGGHSGGHSHGHGSGHSAHLTEQTSRTSVRFGLLRAFDKQRTAEEQPVSFTGVVVEATRFVGPRWQVGGRMALAGADTAPSLLYARASKPSLVFLYLGTDLRYLLSNSTHWRLDALAGLGLHGYHLTDLAKPVVTPCGCTSYVEVAGSSSVLVEAGLGLTYKLWREMWLTSDVRYTYLLGSAPLGVAELQSQWQLTLALTLPSGFRTLGPAPGPGAAGK